MKNFGVIVDGYSTGAGLSEEFSKHEITCIHVQSQKKIPNVYSHTYNKDSYIKNYILNNNFDLLVDSLKKYNPLFVISGAECGIELADQLSEKLKCPSNGTTLSEARRNKYLMMQAVEKSGLDIIPFFSSKNIEDIVSWVLKENYWPLVVKPLTSAGGEGVTICTSLDEVINAYENIMNTKINMLGFENHAVLVQHYIAGEEYVVNTVSYNGQHKLCELWSYTRIKKTGGRQIYDTARTIAFHHEKHKEILDYATKALNALNIKYGPAHVELIKNDNGCFLIEVGARLMGANLPFSLLAKCISEPQALMTVLAYAEPEKFKEKLFSSYKLTQPLVALFMTSDNKGIVRSIDHINEIKSLPSFFDMKIVVKIGNKLLPTIDYQTSPGMIYLSHNSEAVIENDIKTIRSIEKDMFKLDKPIETFYSQTIVA